MSEQNIALPIGVPVPGQTSPTATSPASATTESVPAAAIPAAASNTKLTPLELLKWAFSFPAMLGMLIVGRVFYEGRSFPVDPDVWWHIKVGQDLLRTHHLPTTDIYSWTAANTPWIAYEWLGELPLGLIHRTGGLLGLDFFLIALASIIMLALYWLGTVRSGNSKAAFISALLLTSIAFGNFSLRPQMFGYLFLVLTLGVLEKFRQGVQWPLWTLPPIFLLWVNMHGTFIIGIGVVVLYLLAGLFNFRSGSVEAIAWTRAQRIKLETALLFCLAVLPITPYGSQLAVYPFDMALSQPINVANISEWKPMPFDVLGGKMFLGFIVILFLLQMFFRFSWRLEELLLAVGGTAMACVHVRFILLFVPFFVPLFAASLARWIPAYNRKKDQYLANAVIMAGVAIAMFHYFPSRADLDKKVAKTYPVAALQFLRSHPAPGNLLNDYGFGGYLVLNGEKTFIDGRGDLFERAGVLGDFVHIVNLKPATLAVLRNYNIQTCMLEKGHPLATTLLASPDWHRVYMDETAIILERAPASPSPANASSVTQSSPNRTSTLSASAQTINSPL